jgi:hypothetical protein
MRRIQIPTRCHKRRAEWRIRRELGISQKYDARPADTGADTSHEGPGQQVEAVQARTAAKE